MRGEQWGWVVESPGQAGSVSTWRDFSQLSAKECWKNVFWQLMRRSNTAITKVKPVCNLVLEETA